MFVSALVHLLAAGLMYAGANWTGLIPWRRAVSAHWAERARLLWPARFTASLNIFLLPPILGLMHLVLSPGTSQWWISDGIAAFLGAALAGYYFDREIFPQLNFGNWWRQAIAIWGFQFAVWVPLIAACLLMPESGGVQILLVVGAYLTLHVALQCGLLLKYLRWANYMTSAGPRLQRIVGPIAVRLGVNVRATWQLRGPLANAFASPLTRELAVSDRLLEICNDDEVAAICAHELAHITESKAVLAGRLLSSLRFFPLIFVFPAMASWNFGGLALLLFATSLLDRFARALSQRMERRADAVASTEQTDEGVFARALEKVYRESQIPAVNVGNNESHPHLYDRMVSAGITPDYLRPMKPRRLTLAGWFYSALLTVLTVIAVARVASS